MSLFQPASPQKRLWAGIYGPEGSGKTHTAIDLAMTCRAAFGLEGPIFGIDTEKAIDFHRTRVKEHTGCELMRCRTRKVAELVQALLEAKKARASVVVVDSLTHFLRQSRLDWCDANNKTLATMAASDYGSSDAKFKLALDGMLNGSMNIIICGREGQKYGRYKNKHGQWKEGPIATKMNAGEAGYEVDLLIETTREEVANSKEFKRKAIIKKDRSRTVDGKVFQVPWRVSVELAPYFDYLKGGK